MIKWHIMLPLSNMQWNTSFRPVRATIRMLGHYVWSPIIYSNFYIKTLIINNIYLGQLGFQLSKETENRFFLNYYVQSLIIIIIRKYTPAQLLFILSKELGGSSFLNN